MTSIRVSVIGEGHLADATAHECGLWFKLSAPSEADLLWFAVDMPVNESDESDIDYVMDRLGGTLAHVRPGTPVLISTQVPVGFCAKAEAEFPEHHLAIQPENIRKATAIADFHFQRRIVVGTRHLKDAPLIHRVVSKFCPDPDGIMFMSPESAEMVKHALNSWLAMNIAFANEIGDTCQTVGADVKDVFRGFRSDPRVSGPLEPGGPYRGGTLARDIYVLNSLGAGPLIAGIKASNDRRLLEPKEPSEQEGN